MEYKNKIEIECPECNQKYKVSHNSKEHVEFCSFCGETLLGLDSSDILDDDDVDFDNSIDEDIDDDTDNY